VLLELKNVEVVYSGVVQVLRSVNVDVPQGSVVAILGANGAGKTTMLKAISSLLEVEHGEVTGGELLSGHQYRQFRPCRHRAAGDRSGA
jgi:branched-chain amino acid transport system ATP-binding protein